MNSKLCLGTAQFGNKYGITNSQGKLKSNNINLILKKAVEENINFFDTARSYGNSEKIIGKVLSKTNIKITTKFSIEQGLVLKKEDIFKLEYNFQLSLKYLNHLKIDTYLLHNPYNFKKDKTNLLINWIKSLKDRKLIERFGASIYEENDLDALPLKDIQVIQIPVSIYDQRFLKKSFMNRIKNNNISIHIRSIFLQGLLLQKSSKWPNSINKSFLDHHKNYEKELRLNQLTLLDSAIQFIRDLNFPELVLFGVTNKEELDSIIRSWNSKTNFGKKLNYDLLKWNKVQDIDPRKWV